jgi:hypothetical protein
MTGERTPKVLETIDKISHTRRMRVPTPELNKFVEAVTAANPPVSPGRTHVRILYAAQIGVAPPSFVFFTNVATTLHFSYERFLVNKLREKFGFVGTPIRIQVRRRAKGGGPRKPRPARDKEEHPVMNASEAALGEQPAGVGPEGGKRKKVKKGDHAASSSLCLRNGEVFGAHRRESAGGHFRSEPVNNPSALYGSVCAPIPLATCGDLRCLHAFGSLAAVAAVTTAYTRWLHVGIRRRSRSVFLIVWSLR